MCHGVTESLDEVILPNLDAAYRLARWLVRNEADAESVVLEASSRAWRSFRTFPGRNGRAWFLRIVRTTCWNWHPQRVDLPTSVFDERQPSGAGLNRDPETLLDAHGAARIDQALEDLPERFRELLVLRELEGLSYEELAEVLEIPVETVMSRLTRARQAFRMELDVQWKRFDPRGERRSRERDSEASYLPAAIRRPCIES
jgi:RNA polymerase sigma-70 factor (ECF subfamily)